MHEKLCLTFEGLFSCLYQRHRGLRSWRVSPGGSVPVEAELRSSALCAEGKHPEGSRVCAAEGDSASLLRSPLLPPLSSKVEACDVTKG